MENQRRMQSYGRLVLVDDEEVNHPAVLEQKPTPLLELDCTVHLVGRNGTGSGKLQVSTRDRAA